jgi:hypothetical protein
MEANECKGKYQPVSFLRQKKRQTRRTYSYGYYGDKYNGRFREPIHIIHDGSSRNRAVAMRDRRVKP